MSETVMADAQASKAFILRPFENFEATYQGESADRPIMLTELGQPFDEAVNSGVDGYDPRLVRGLSVPMGSRILLWLPILFWVSASDPVTVNRYEWRLFWRLRNVFDFNNFRKSYHYPKQADGIPETILVPPMPARQRRVIIPCAENSVVYNGDEPGVISTGSIDNAYLSASQSIFFERFYGANWAGQRQNPLIPNGTRNPYQPDGSSYPNGTLGSLQQGIADPGNPATLFPATGPGFMLHEMQAMGDELLIGVQRESTEAFPDWDFTSGDEPGPDYTLSTLLGNGLGEELQDLGVFVFTANTP